MARTRNKAKSGSNREDRRVHLELTRSQLILYALGLTAALAWMFVFGILVGRGLPLTTPGDASLKGQLAHLLGLDRAPPKPDPNASETWKTREEMLQALTYHEDLKGSAEPSPPVPASPSESPAAGPGSKPGAQDRMNTAGPYVLMVSSLRNKDNADALVSRLQARGYAPRLEAVQMAEAGLWYRVLIGHFSSRREAQQFAADFNRKENMQGLVIQVER